jgi:hypothetical protein
MGPAEDPHVIFTMTAVESHWFDMVELQKRPTLASPSIEADEGTTEAFLLQDRPLRRGRNVTTRGRLVASHKITYGKSPAPQRVDSSAGLEMCGLMSDGAGDLPWVIAGSSS